MGRCDEKCAATCASFVGVFSVNQAVGENWLLAESKIFGNGSRELTDEAEELPRGHHDFLPKDAPPWLLFCRRISTTRLLA